MKFNQIKFIVMILLVVVSCSFAQLPVTAGLQLHLDADAIEGLNDSDTVTVWHDQSGNNYNATGPVPPIFKENILNGQPAVRFTGGSYLSCGDIEVHDNTLGLTVIAVGINYSTATNNKYVISKYDAGAGQRQWFLSSNQATVQESPGTFYSEQALSFSSTASRQILMFRWSPNYNMEAFRNGSFLGKAAVSAPFTSSTTEPLIVGGMKDGTMPFEGDISEIIIFNRSLNASESNQINEYLSNKYNISINLLPPRAENPSPRAGAVEVAVDEPLQLNWTGSPEIQNRDYIVYFGTSEQNLNPIYSGSQTSTPLGQEIDFGTRYFWRVDTTDTVTSDLYPGNLWFFDTVERSCLPDLRADINKDCIVDLKDFSVVASDFGRCRLEPSESCNDAANKPFAIKLWKEIDISEYKGAYVNIGDMNNDGKVDYLLSFVGPWSTVERLIAIGHDGELLWEIGDTSRTSQEWIKGLPACKGLNTIYDIDEDGKSEVIVEFWNNGSPELRLLDGETGNVLHSAASPFLVSNREPGGRNVPMALVMYPFGTGGAPWFVLKDEASNSRLSMAAAYDAQLNQQWYIAPYDSKDIGHNPTVYDIDGDGGDDVVFGQLAVEGATGNTIFRRSFGWHADMTDIMEIDESLYIYIAVCYIGPAYSLEADGTTIWQKSQDEVWHAQGLWAGDFIPARDGNEVVMLNEGHIGKFLTVDAQTGESIATFEHRRNPGAYPDTPMPIKWISPNIDSLWIPSDRMIVDGMGNYVQNLGTYEDLVVDKLNPGDSVSSLAVQAIPVDVCGDAREELLLYVPYKGESIFIFTQPDSDGAVKRYVHEEQVYNKKSYF